MSTPLTGQNMIDRFENMIDDSPEGGSDYELFLLNNAKDEVEASRDWYFLRGFDNSVTATPSDNYLTMHSLPADFLAPRTLFLNGDISPYILIPFELRERFKDIYKRYYIDYKSNQYAICGKTSGSKTVDLYYGASSPSVTLLSSPIWPAAFHPLLVFKMAEIWGSTSDADDINFRMSQQQLRQYANLLKGFIQWDARLKTAEYNAKNERRADLSSYPDIVGTDYLF